MKKIIILTYLFFAGIMLSPAQERTDSYLKEISEVVKQLRKNNNSVRNNAISALSAEKKPKITLMDEIKWAGREEEKTNEVKGSKGCLFKLNQVVAYVYKNQNHQLVSKNNMLNGNEKDVNYSLIEKSVKRGGKVTYKIAGRFGMQEFLFIPYNPNIKYAVYMTCGDTIIRRPETEESQTGDCHIILENVSRGQAICFSIYNMDDNANKDAVGSFAILNYNPQK